MVGVKSNFPERDTAKSTSAMNTNKVEEGENHGGPQGTVSINLMLRNYTNPIAKRNHKYLIVIKKHKYHNVIKKRQCDIP